MDQVKSSFAWTMLESLQEPERRNFSDIYPNADEETLDFLDKLLQFNPAKRLTAEEALAHPYLKQFHVELDEPSCESPITAPIDDNRKFEAAVYRERLYRDIREEARRAEERRRRCKKRSNKDSSRKKSKQSSTG